jgi:hypothetical protein
MTLTEWLIFIAVIDGPLAGLIYFIWKSMRAQEKIWKK